MLKYSLRSWLACTVVVVLTRRNSVFGNILHDIALGIVFGCAWKCNYAGISCMRAFVSEDRRNTVGGILLSGVSLVDDYPSIWNSTFSGSVLISAALQKWKAV